MNRSLSSRTILVLGTLCLAGLVGAALWAIQQTSVPATTPTPSPAASAETPVPSQAAIPLDQLETLPPGEALALFLDSAQQQFPAAGSSLDDRLAEPAARLADHLNQTDRPYLVTLYAADTLLALQRTQALRSLLDGAGLGAGRVRFEARVGVPGVLVDTLATVR